MATTEEIKDIIIEIRNIMYELGFNVEAVKHYVGYSGRGMYGQETDIAVTMDAGSSERELFVAIGYGVASGDIPEECLGWFTKRDHMGLGVILYDGRY